VNDHILAPVTFGEEMVKGERQMAKGGFKELKVWQKGKDLVVYPVR